MNPATRKRTESANAPGDRMFSGGKWPRRIRKTRRNNTEATTRKPNHRLVIRSVPWVAWLLAAYDRGIVSQMPQKPAVKKRYYTRLMDLYRYSPISVGILNPLIRSVFAHKVKRDLRTVEMNPVSNDHIEAWYQDHQVFFGFCLLRSGSGEVGGGVSSENPTCPPRGFGDTMPPIPQSPVPLARVAPRRRRWPGR